MTYAVPHQSNWPDQAQQRTGADQQAQLDPHDLEPSGFPEQQRDHRPAGPLRADPGRADQEGQRGGCGRHGQPTCRQRLGEDERRLVQELLHRKVLDGVDRTALQLLVADLVLGQAGRSTGQRQPVRVRQALLPEPVLLYNDLGDVALCGGQLLGRGLAELGGGGDPDHQQVAGHGQ